MPRPHRADERADSPPPRWSAVLRALREAAGVTQDGWAAYLGYSRATVQRWERGESVPDAAAERALVEILDEKGLLRSYQHGPLAGVTVTADLLRDVFAEGRAGVLPAAGAPLPPNVTRLTRGARASAATAPIEPPSNLRPQPSSFIGRERETAEVRLLLGATRLLSLVGPGGVGKTRLAIHAAEGMAGDVSDGIWLAALGPLADPALVARAVAAAIGVREEAGRPVAETIIAALAQKRALLILDNCEHVAGAAAALAAALLRGCPAVRILATSRAPLDLPDESVWRVPAMTVPGSAPGVRRPASESIAATDPAAGPEHADAVRLFAERARAALVTFALSETNIGAVGAICRRLDGIPLAIELAAARVRILTPDQIAARLDARFRLLTGGSAEEPRRRTLRAALDWSHDLLGAPERALFRRLAIFVGGCEIEAVEAVCGDGDLSPGAILDLLTSLVDKSLVVVEHDGEAARYRLLETVRAYALEHLAEADEREAIAERHAHHFADVLRDADAGFAGAEQGRTLRRIALDLDNARALLAFAEERGWPEELAESLYGLWRFWFFAGYASEGRRWLARALAVRHRPTTRAKLLDAAAALAHSQGDFVAARGALEESVAIWRDLDAPLNLGGALNTLGLVELAQGRQAEALPLLDEALALFQRAGHEALAGRTLNNLAVVATDLGDFDRAATYHAESLAVKRRLGDQHGIAVSLHNLAEVAMHRGGYAEAVPLLTEALAIERALGLRQAEANSTHSLALATVRLGDAERARRLFGEALAIYRELEVATGVALSLEGLAEVAAAAGEAEHAARLLGATEALRERLDAPLAPADRPALERVATAAAARIGDDAFRRAWETGRAMNDAQAAELAARVAKA